tara:strand:- start:212 stop:625 length:414 start_codon:yes stop_codon:yes gene_type:complete
MNSLKTFLYFIGYFMATAIATRIIVFIPYKLFDNFSDYFYVPVLAIALAYTPLRVATDKALDITNNFNRTLNIIVITFSIIAIVSFGFGVLDIWVRFYLDESLYAFVDESNIFSHWIYYFPYSITLAITSHEIFNGN